MPLIAGKSKQSFEKNFKTEMKAGKPKDQSLAISYDIQRRNKRKKMADGGKAEPSPTPKEVKLDMDPIEIQGTTYDSKKYASGGMVKGQENDGQPSIKPGAKDTYSSPAMREFMASKAPKGSDTERDSDEHAPDKAAYHGQRYAKGGMIEEDEAHLESSFPPSSDKDQPKAAYNEKHEAMTSGSPDESKDHSMESEDDMLRRHADEKAAHYARGGKVQEHEGEDGEMEGEHPASIAEAILSKRKYAKGGMISSDSDDEGPGTRRDFNIESKKENYTDSGENFSYSSDGEDGDSEESQSENKHDMVDRIRRKLRGF